MTTKGEILDFLTRNKQHFRDRYGIVKIGLFGSYARDEQAENSDIDLIVEFERNTPNLYDLKNDLKGYIKEISLCLIAFDINKMLIVAIIEIK